MHCQEEQRQQKEMEALQRKDEERFKEEEKNRKKEEEKQRRAIILEQYKIKKAMEEAEKEVKNHFPLSPSPVEKKMRPLPLNSRLLQIYHSNISLKHNFIYVYSSFFTNSRRAEI